MTFSLEGFFVHLFVQQQQLEAAGSPGNILPSKNGFAYLGLWAMTDSIC